MKKKKLNTTDDDLYLFLILNLLIEHGGRAEPRVIIDKIGDVWRERLTTDDLSDYESGNDIRWENRVKWTRKHMVRDGYLSGESPKGIWEITYKGRIKYGELRRELLAQSSQRAAPLPKAPDSNEI